MESSSLLKSLGIIVALTLAFATPVVVSADGPESGRTDTNGIVKSEVFYPPQRAVASLAGTAPMAGVSGTGVVKSVVFTPSARRAPGGAAIPSASDTRSDVINPDLAEETLDSRDEFEDAAIAADPGVIMASDAEADEPASASTEPGGEAAPSALPTAGDLGLVPAFLVLTGIGTAAAGIWFRRRTPTA